MKPESKESEELQLLRKIDAHLYGIDGKLTRIEKRATKAGAIAGGVAGGITGGIVAMSISLIRVKLGM